MSTQRTSTSESKCVDKSKRTTTIEKQETYPRYKKEISCCQKPQPLCQPASMSPSNNQKSCSTQVTTAPPCSEKPELGGPNKPVSPTSVSVLTETRPRRGVGEPTYLKDYIRSWTVNSRFTNIECKRQISRIRTWLGTISLIYIYILFVFVFS